MRTSSQLRKSNLCDRNPGIDVSETSNLINRARAQRQVVLRMLQGEPIEDIRGELDSILMERNYKWENNEQKNYNLALYTARIKKMTAWELQHKDNLMFLDPDEEERYTVDFYGESIKVLPDYFRVIDDDVYVCKIKTSKFPTDEKKDLSTNEAYTLGLLGEKLFPGKKIHVQYLHLGSRKEDPATYSLNYDVRRGDGQLISEMVFDEKIKEAFDKIHETEKDATCSGNDCAGCSMNNVCHYEEPPIALDEEKSVRPIGDIRLTKAQEDVVEYESGIARINAGAGAGKTLVVALRVAKLIEKGYRPEDICCLTFTKAGAEEMATRVSVYCAEKGILVDPEKLVATTFNSFCMNIIMDNYEVLGYTDSPRVIPDEVKNGILNKILDSFQRIPQWNYSQFSDIRVNRYTKTALKSIGKIFEEIKKEGYTIDNNPFTSIGDSDHVIYSEESVSIIFQMYSEFTRIMKERNMLEYDDQIREVMRLATEINPDLFSEMAFKHIIVDEFQDTDYPQIKLLQEIMQTEHFKSLMCVGDDSQSIFAFRHTSPEYMINFGNYFGQFNDFSLVENHRSNKATIDYANKINKLNLERVDKDLIATKPLGNIPEINGFYSAKQEYSYIADRIKEEIDNGADPSQIAVLGSTWNELKAIASALTEKGIPSVLGREIKSENSRIAALCSFYDAFKNGSTKGLMDYQNARMHGAMKGMTKENIDILIGEFKEELSDVKKSLGVFKEYAKVLDENEKDACYQQFLEDMEYIRSMDELNEFFEDFKLYGQDSYFTRTDINGATYAGVQVTTVHAAKGLEWDSTYLTLSGFDRVANHTRRNLSEQNETNRKWFVGATRAREKLVMTGQYILKMTNNSVIMNDIVAKAYDLAGKAPDYDLANYNKVQMEEKKAMADKAKDAFNKVMSSGNIGIATGKMRGRNRQSENKHSGWIHIPTEEITNDEGVTVRRRVRRAIGPIEESGAVSRQMTPEEEAQYDRMTEGATQITLDDYMNREENKSHEDNGIEIA